LNRTEKANLEFLNRVGAGFVGRGDGARVGLNVAPGLVGCRVTGEGVGGIVGSAVGSVVGESIGLSVGPGVGFSVRGVGDVDGCGVGEGIGDVVGAGVGKGVLEHPMPSVYMQSTLGESHIICSKSERQLGSVPWSTQRLS